MIEQDGEQLIKDSEANKRQTCLIQDSLKMHLGCSAEAQFSGYSLKLRLCLFTSISCDPIKADRAKYKSKQCPKHFLI